MLRIAVFADDPAVVDSIAVLLDNIRLKYSNKPYVDIFLSGKGFTDCIEDKPVYDIAYIDMEFGQLNGVDIGHLIRRESAGTLIVFISSPNSYYKPAFDVQPFNFMDKPINKTEFEQLFEQMYARIFFNDSLFQYSTNKVDKRIAYRDILYFESSKRKITMHTLYSTDTFYGSITKLAKELKRKEFIMFHQSFLVNYAHIAEFSYTKVKLINRKVIAIPVNRRKTVRTEYMEIKWRNSPTLSNPK